MKKYQLKFTFLFHKSIPSHGKESWREGGANERSRRRRRRRNERKEGRFQEDAAVVGPAPTRKLRDPHHGIIH
ncbi:unnamed protein product [Linum tenue]|uniref:Uncharacterized protein n=1 Tax=Linum tenue TaxID=586396 RepID=A0AAV0S5Z4_9ROSI|nr:unnamed protein product [Linum tenue]